MFEAKVSIRIQSGRVETLVSIISVLLQKVGEFSLLSSESKVNQK